MTRPVRPVVAFSILLASAGCGRPGPLPVPAPEPAAPPTLALHVVYPRLAADSVVGWRATLDSRDSAFVFGWTTRPDAAVLVNGQRVPVAPTGGWLAWLGLARDTVATMVVQAVAGSETTSVAFTALLPRGYAPSDSGVWVDTLSLEPTGTLWLRPGEGAPLAVRAAPGAAVRLILPDSTVIPLVADAGEAGIPWGERAFSTVASVPRPAEAGWYRAWWVGALGEDPGPVLAPSPATPGVPQPMLEVARDGATARVAWPLRIAVLDSSRPVVSVVNDDTAATGLTDGVLAGRPTPFGTYHWFFPNGTRAVVSGRRNDQVRLQLSGRSAAWVDAGDVQALASGTPPLTGTTQALRLFPVPDGATLRVPLPGRVPFRVDEDERRLTLTLYGVAANADWIQYGPADPLVRQLTLEAPAEDETRIVVDLTAPVWGYRTRWSGHDLLLEIRRPPALDPRRPLRGLLVALDPGHPPAGATGPTGVFEGDVVLAVARAAARLFEEAGARVLLLRADTLPLGLVERVRRAEEANADLLISIHANALPDGVNPFVNSGTSTYYFHPRATDFARNVNAALVRRLGFRDLGFGRADLALARPTWMPAILAEGAFLMVPEQEAVLISVAGQRRYAEGLVDGTAAFLAARVRAR